jgi:hypothetical protein
MPRRPARINLSIQRLSGLLRQRRAVSPSWAFLWGVGRLIWQYKWYSLIIVGVTIFQEFAALWPVNLLGQFVDRLETGELGNVVWLLFGASLFYPGLARANVILRHIMFYNADFEKRIEMIIAAGEEGYATDLEAAGAAHTRIVNAVSGITNTMYHVLGSFTPVIIKVIIVSSRLLGYNRRLGLVYLASLLLPGALTIVFNRVQRVLLDSQYSVIGTVSGSGIKTISDRENVAARERFLESMRTRRQVLVSLLSKSQTFIYIREATLICSQFLVVFLALSLREELGITPGDFTKIIGYTAQVASAFINAAANLDNIVSYSRAYHVFVKRT